MPLKLDKPIRYESENGRIVLVYRCKACQRETRLFALEAAKLGGKTDCPLCERTEGMHSFVSRLASAYAKVGAVDKARMAKAHAKHLQKKLGK